MSTDTGADTGLVSDWGGGAVTVRELVAMIGRRWYVFLLVLLAFGALAVSFQREGGSFYTHTAVTFTLPDRPTLLPDSGARDANVIAYAGTVATLINDGKPVATYSSADAPYYGAGVREGSMVSLRNNGNQWIVSFPTATIDIQIVGHSYEWVADRQQSMLDLVMDVTRGQQTSAVVPADDQITATIAPLSTEIAEITAGRQSQVLAVGAMGLAGLVAACTLSVATDRVIRGARHRMHERQSRVAVAVMRGTGKVGA